MKARAHARFVAAGGCAECNGTGRVLTWATLDSCAYDEFDLCPECDGSGPVNPAGYAPGTGSNRLPLGGPIRPSTALPCGRSYFVDDAEFEEYEALREEARRFAYAATIRDDLRSIAIEKNNVVEVTSTNKSMERAGAKVGDRLVVFWTQLREYGYSGSQSLKVGGIRVSDGAKVWTTHARVKVVGRYAEIPEANDSKRKPSTVAVRLPVVRHARSGKAVMVRDEVHGDVWLPVSQITVSDDVVVSMAAWLMSKKFPMGLGGVAELDADGIDRATIGRVTTG